MLIQTQALSATYAKKLDGPQTQQLLLITERHIENVDKNETQKQQGALQAGSKSDTFCSFIFLMKFLHVEKITEPMKRRSL